MSATVGGEKAACKHRDSRHGASADRSTHWTCTFFVTTYQSVCTKRETPFNAQHSEPPGLLVLHGCRKTGKTLRQGESYAAHLARWHPKQRSDRCSSRGLGIERRTGKGDHSSARSLRAPAGSRSSARARKPETSWSSGTMQGVCREPRALVTC